MLIRIFCTAMMMLIGISNANAASIQNMVIKATAKVAVKQIYSSLGLPDQDVQKALIDLQSAVEKNTTQLNSLQLDISEIDEKLSKQKVLEYIADIQTAASDVSRWKNNSLSPTPAQVDSLVSSLGKAVLNLDTALNESRTGLIPALMKSKKFARLSDLHEYWAAIDNLRYLMSPTFAQAVVTLAALREMTDNNFKAEQLKNGCTTRASNNPVTTSAVKPVTSFLAVTTSGGAQGGCRAGIRGEGHPNTDPQAKGNSNKYYDVKLMTKGLIGFDKCKQACVDKNASCVGIEYSAGSGRCELWKANIAIVQPSGDYQCLKKVTGLPLTQNAKALTPTECDEKFARISDATMLSFYKNVDSAVRGMYEHGISLDIDRKPEHKFVHLINKPWALSPPINMSAGYYATATAKDLLPKLQEMVNNFAVLDGRPAIDGNKTLEKFLSDNGIPTSFVDQQSWRCDALGQMGGGTAGYRLKVMAIKIRSNEIQQPELPLGFFIGSSECQSQLEAYKRIAGEQYRVDSNRNPIGGLQIKQYYGCGDNSLCDLSKPTKNVNEVYFGRFFTYNLSAAGAGGRVGDRRNSGGRAALTNPQAIEAYRLSR